jgi:hypothetical protein
MQIEELEFRNIGPYGNNSQSIKFEKTGSLNLLTGKNGHGKCVHPDTMISIKFDDPELEKKFKEYANIQY